MAYRPQINFFEKNYFFSGRALGRTIGRTLKIFISSFRGEQILSFATNQRSLAQLESGKRICQSQKKIQKSENFDRFFDLQSVTTTVCFDQRPQHLKGIFAVSDNNLL